MSINCIYKKMQHLALTWAPSAREKGEITFARKSCDIVENTLFINLARRLSCDVHQNKPVVTFYPAMFMIKKLVNTFCAPGHGLERHGTEVHGEDILARVRQRYSIDQTGSPNFVDSDGLWVADGYVV